MSSQEPKPKKSQIWEETKSEPAESKTNALEAGLKGNPDSIADLDNASINSEESDFGHLDKTTKVVQRPISAFEESLNNSINSADPDVLDSSTYSDDSVAANISQSSASHIGPEGLSDAYQPSTASKEDSDNMATDYSDYETSDTASDVYHTRYRQSGPDLMTLHVPTGEMNGKRHVYLPVYQRDSSGKLLKLMRSKSRGWAYKELKTMTEEEVQGGLKKMVKPKAEVVLQDAKPKKSVGRRTLADFSLPETKSKGGWGWL